MRASIAVIAFFICLLGIAQNATIATRLGELEKEVTLEHSSSIDQYIAEYTSVDYKTRQYALDLFLPYDQILREKFIAKKVPEELRYLALSYYLDGTDNSRVGGPFFLSKEKALAGKLHISSYVDERMDIMKAAEVFCAEYKASTQSWPEQIRRYILGDSTASSAGRSAPYTITSAYPKYVSAVYVADQCQEMGWKAKDTEATTVVEIVKYTSLYQISRACGADYQEVKRLNPTYIREIIPNDGKQYFLTLPVGAAKRFSGLGNGAYDYTATEVFTSTEVKLIELSASDTTKQVVPVLTEPMVYEKEVYKEEAYGKESSLADIVYTVRGGDVLSKIAKLFNCEVNQIRRWNSLSGDYIDINQKLIIKVDPTKQSYYQEIVNEISEEKSALANVTYTVRSGDILLKIADLYDCEVAQIKRWNSIDKDYIDINQKLIIKVSPNKRAYYQQIDKMTNEQRNTILKKD